MEDPWLESLSEDWISQPRSDGSSAGSIPLPAGNAISESSSSRDNSSRSRKQSTSPKFSDSVQLPLSERSLNNNNIAPCQRALRRPSKLKHEISGAIEDPRLLRTVSIATTGSIQCHTVQHKLLSVSPKKSMLEQETLEWKRRLLHGEVAYGEQRDLFSPAGLENIFRPPSQITPSSGVPKQLLAEDITMHSSPLPYDVGKRWESKSLSITDIEKENQMHPSKLQQNMKYKIMDPGSLQFSEEDISRSSSFHPDFLASQKASTNVEEIAIADRISRQPGLPLQSSALAKAARVVSVQSDVRHEDLSPIFISRHNTVDGRIDYSALDLPAAELQRLQDLAIKFKIESSPSREGGSQLSPGNNTINTEELTHVGKFVNLGRGGEFENGSFQQRMLSPSSLPPVEESAILCEISVEASTPKNLPSFRQKSDLDKVETPPSDSVSPEIPRAPNPSPIKDENLNSRPGSGCPLKLFGTYDTFTNQKLLRRLSQFEDSLPEEKDKHNLLGAKHGEERNEPTNHINVNEAYIPPSGPSNQSREPSQHMNRFGDGDLDRFEFSEGSAEPSRSMVEAVNTSPSSPHAAGSHIFHLQPSPTLEAGIISQWQTRRINKTMKERIVTTRRSVRLTSTGLDMLSSSPVPKQLETLETPRKRNGDSEGKRLLHSPPKNPTPKRRRTLHKTDISHASSDGRISQFVKESHEQIQSVVGKKRKDARHGDNQVAADPQILAMRQILRPKTLTSSQCNSQDHKGSEALKPRINTSERAWLDQQDKIARVQAELDATAPSRTSTATRVAQPMYSDSRKGSVTTQDFLDEAKKIMAGIRGKARPSNGLASVEESETENGQFPISRETEEDDSYEESTKEPFSRPPSREGGGPLPRLPQKQQNPEVLDHLRKYEEISDIDGIIASSPKSASQVKDLVNAANNLDRLAEGPADKGSGQDLDLDQSYRSDPPNIRITEYPELQRKRKHSSSTAPTRTTDDHEAEFPSHDSNGSSSQSMGRSVPTGSSRGSESKHIIAPHTVSHLIPEQLAGMIFDRQKHIWVKQKVVSSEEEYGGILPSEDTNDDPFDDIPDLTVDESQELGRITAVVARKREEARVSEVQRYQMRQRDVEHPHNDCLMPSKPNLATNNLHNAGSVDPSKLTRHASNATAQDTQLASCSNAPDDLQETGIEPTSEVEQGIPINKSRMGHKKYSSSRRNVTISFSSPLASIIPPDVPDDGLRNDADDSLDDDSALIDQTLRRRSYQAQSHHSQHIACRRLSLTGHTFLARPVSRIDEQDEDSFVGHMDDESHRKRVSLVISTPLPIRRSTDSMSLVHSSSVARHSEGILQLTPLSDFSMNQSDESFALELSYVGQQRRRASSCAEKRSLSLSVKELVQRITDIEPYEPFWEHIKKIELRGKNLQTLHMLGKFCSQLEELDVSDNRIDQLDGAPGSIRNLRISHNCLSNLTSWHHLTNLQYVDISNNDLTSFEGFENLVHLRGLRADNNKINSLRGVISLDGLINLRLRGNMIQSVNFAGCLLQRLTDLDLKGNCIEEVRSLQELRSLTTLNLEDNELQAFAQENCEYIRTLKYLKLGGNKLEYLDITPYPNIRLLYADRNRLGRVTGVFKAKYLDSLSLREQQHGSIIDKAVLNEVFEVRKLFLSGNLLTSFEPSIDFLNLQYLDLANCGLETLPIEFGQMTLNLRVLNLNFNALRDIKPLLGIVRLKKLYLSGNRLARLRKTTNVLAQFSSLTKVDVRDNPLTLGFYPPLSERRLVIHDENDGERNASFMDPFTLPEGDAEKDTAYAGRLDMETKMRRRVYEMLVLGGCTMIKMLDGLAVDRGRVAARDKVWEELVKAELVYENVTGTHATEVEAHVSEAVAEGREKNSHEGEITEGKEGSHSDVASQERWPAEDSFS